MPIRRVLVVLLALAGVLFAARCISVPRAPTGGPTGTAQHEYPHSDVDFPDDAKPESGDDQLFAILTWLIWICIIGGVLSFVASTIFPVIPTRTSATAVAVGIGLAALKGVLHAILLGIRIAISVAVVACAAILVGAFYRFAIAWWNEAPIAGHTGWDAIRRVWPWWPTPKPAVSQAGIAGNVGLPPAAVSGQVPPKL